MRESGVRGTARRAGQSFVTAAQKTARVGKSAASKTNRVVHRMTNASGAGRTGLSHLIELTAATSIGDSFVAVALAGTLFFSTSVNQARGKVALALLITMAPFALLGPFVGPVLDRIQSGRRYILLGTVLARALLCWGLAGAVAHHDIATMLPAAFGVLLLQKAYTVTKASVTPRLRPAQLSLVTANARISLATLIASTIGVPLAAGVDFVAGGHAAGAGWVLRVGTIIYLTALVPGIRLPARLDAPPPTRQAKQGPATADHAPDHVASRPPSGGGNLPVEGAGGIREYAARGGLDGQAHGAEPAADGTQRAGNERAGNERAGNGARPTVNGSRRAANGAPRVPTAGSPLRWLRARLFPRPVGPSVAQAMGVNATLRAYSGFMIFFLAILLRSIHFHGINDKVALGAMFGAAAVGGFVGTAMGAAMRSRAPQAIAYGMLATTTLLTAACAIFFNLWAALIVAFAAAIGQTLVKLALDSVVQREIRDDVRSSTFAVSETLHQLSWVVGGLLGLALSLTDSGVTGLAFAAVCLAISLTVLLEIRRRHNLAARRNHPQASRTPTVRIPDAQRHD